MAYERKPPFRGNNTWKGRPKLSKEERAKLVEERLKQQHEEHLANWIPKTKLGKLVRDGKIKDIDEVLKQKVLEPEIIDLLIKLDNEVLNIGQAKGKFGGGKRRAWRQTQKKTSEGNVPTFSCMCIAGNKEGYFGMGYGRAKETLPPTNYPRREPLVPGLQRAQRGLGPGQSAGAARGQGRSLFAQRLQDMDLLRG